MLVDKIKNYKKWKIGDTFALEIKKCQNQEFIGKYLILNYLGNTGHYCTPTFYVKLTKDSNVPKSMFEIEKLEYIKTMLTVIEDAYPPGMSKPSEMILIPDEYGYLYTYKLSIYTTNKKYKIRDDLKYVGNYNLTPPVDEYIPYTFHNIPDKMWEDVDNFIIDSYVRYNLRDPKLYNFECANKMHQEAREVNELILETLNNINENKEKFKKEKMTFDSITYVGEDPNHLDYKK